MGLKISRKEVTDEQLRDAYYGGSSPESQQTASDNRGILHSVSSKFVRTGQLDEDEASACEMNALWRCLSYHDDSHGQKFTTSLYRFIEWECRRERSNKKKKAERHKMERSVLPLIARHAVDEHDSWGSSDTRECDLVEAISRKEEILTKLDELPYAWQRTIIRQYYLQGMTHEQIGFHNGGYSKETARLKLDQALRELKLLYHQTA